MDVNKNHLWGGNMTDTLYLREELERSGISITFIAKKIDVYKKQHLDYSCWPLWCGGLNVKTDRRIMGQLAYYFCSQDCDDPDYIAARNAILDFANQFYRVDEGACGRLEAK